MKSALQQYLTPPKRERLPDSIAAKIKALILSKKIAYGEKLPPERVLADMLQVSRVVVKQALMLLEQSGFVEIKRGPKGGAFTTNQSYKPFSNYIKDLFVEGEMSLIHFCEARTAVECYSVRLAAQKAAKEDIQRLEALNQKFFEEKLEADTFAGNNRVFHITIAEISGNPLIKSMIQSLLEYFSGFWKERYSLIKDTSQFRLFVEDTYKRHQRIADALKKKDVALCVKAMRVDTGLHKFIENLE